MISQDVVTTDADAPRDVPAPQRGFVRRLGHCLVRDGARVRVVGSSAFHLQEESVRQELGWGPSRDSVQRTFDVAARAGVRVLRIAAFNERIDDVATIQSSPGVLREEGLRGLDRVIEQAHAHDILLIVVLSNYWEDYGGIPQYAQWLGLPSDYPERGLLWREARIRAALADYATRIVTRVNTRTSRRYANEPTILAWELVNEPRGTGLTDRGVTFADAMHTLAVAVHSAGAQQLVVVGDEGYDADTRGYDTRYWDRMDDRFITTRRGESFQRIVTDPAIDAATLHWYPDHWTVPTADAREAGVRWLREHAAIVARVNKPMLFEEFGLMAHRHPDATERMITMERWFEQAHALETIAAVMPWGMHYDPAFRDRDGLEWGAREGDDPMRALVSRWSQRFAQDQDLSRCNDSVP
ncbi:MAG: cellulase family glycosylhydrolase [Deltaproteobacteria bacterium]|nr:cellulase family glycosylhydrolase [Deltaproteobacteria bacterium]